MNDDATVFCQFDPVAVMPDIGILFEISPLVSGPVVVVPEADGHARERLGADQFAFHTFKRIAVVIKHFDRHTQAAHLDFTGPHWA